MNKRYTKAMFLTLTGLFTGLAGWSQTTLEVGPGKAYSTIKDAIENRGTADKIVVFGDANGEHYEPEWTNPFGYTDVSNLEITSPAGTQTTITGAKTFNTTWTNEGTVTDELGETRTKWKSNAISEDIWQLFIGETMMVNARFPNANHPFLDNFNPNGERSFWNRKKTWIKVADTDDNRTGKYKPRDGDSQSTAAGWRNRASGFGQLNTENIEHAPFQVKDKNRYEDNNGVERGFRHNSIPHWENELLFKNNGDPLTYNSGEGGAQKKLYSQCETVFRDAQGNVLGNVTRDNYYHGWITESGSRMQDSGIDFDNKNAVLNINSFTTYSGTSVFWNEQHPVTDSRINPGEFKYRLDEMELERTGTSEVDTIDINHSHGYFYFENDEEFLDTEYEWYFDSANKEIYIVLNTGETPPAQIKGKTQTYAMKFAGHHTRIDERIDELVIENFKFFATTVVLDDCVNSKIQNNIFDYPSYSKRMLGYNGPIDITRFDITKSASGTDDDGLLKWKKPEFYTNNLFYNNIISYSDGMAFQMVRGVKDQIINNSMRYIDLSGARGGGIGVDFRSGFDTDFSRNTLEKCGASAATKAANNCSITLNRITEWGYLQNDGTGVQVGNGGQLGSVMSHNWVYNAPKSAMRFDGGEDNDPYKECKMLNGTMAYNVSFNTPIGFMVKGDDHRLYGNLAFNNPNGGTKLLHTTATSSGRDADGNRLKVHDQANRRTRYINNVMSDESRDRRGNAKSFPIFMDEDVSDYVRNGFLVDGTYGKNFVPDNINGDIFEVIRDPFNLDFRPKEDGKLHDKGDILETEDLVIINTKLQGIYNDLVARLPDLDEDNKEDQKEIDLYNHLNSSYGSRIGVDGYTSRTVPNYTANFKGDAPDLGPYELGDENYWIPGTLLDKASMPIPPTETENAQKTLDLMWLPAINTTKTKVYFGTDESSLNQLGDEITVQATGIEQIKAGNFNNILYIADHDINLDSTTRYYWRVDCQVNGNWITGDVWNFIAGGKPYKDCSTKVGAIYNLENPLGKEDKYSAPIENLKDQDRLDAGEEITLEGTNKMHINIVNEDIAKNLGDRRSANRKHPWNSLNVDIREYPFLKFDYVTHRQEDDFEIQIYAESNSVRSGWRESTFPIEANHVTDDGVDESKYVTKLIDFKTTWDDYVEAQYKFDAEVLNNLEFIFGTDTDTDWDATQKLVMNNFKIGWDAIEEDLTNATIGDGRTVDIKEGDDYEITINEFDVTANLTYVDYGGNPTTNSYNYPRCFAGKDGWSVRVLPGDDYSLNGNTVTVDAGIEVVSPRVEFLDNGNVLATSNVTINVELDPSLSNNAFKSEYTNIFPNPATNSFRLSNIDNIENVSIYNIQGKRLIETSNVSNEISIEKLNKGIYFVTVNLINGNSETIKLVKE